MGRLVAFATGAGLALRDLAGWGSVGLFWMLLPFAVFLALAIWHALVLKKRREMERRIEFYERCLARVEDRWKGKGEDGLSLLPENHPYALDLDVVGEGGLFQRIWISGSPMGARTLGAWMLQAADADTILRRQEAVKEARDALNFREELSIHGNQSASGTGELCDWGTRKSSGALLGWRIVAGTLSLASLATAILWWSGAASVLPFAAVVLMVFLVGLKFRHLRKEVRRGCGEVASTLLGFRQTLQRVEKGQFNAPLFHDLMASLKRDGGAASRSIGQLQRWLDMLEGGRNQFLALFAPFVLWETQCALGIEAWRRRVGPRFVEWLEVVGEVEALLAVAGYAFESDQPTFPEVSTSQTVYLATELEHPLMPHGQCVPNDAALGHAGQIWMVSGSNMSGKSTWLRTLGVSSVLMNLGAPVRASSMKSSPFVLGASIRILDSLHEGTSRFYREILRLKQISDLAGAKRPLLFLLDEILHGTNSADRQTGVEAFVRSMLETNSVGAITTHDLALARIGDEFQEKVRNMHFRSDVNDSGLTFDYRIHPGVVTESNALALMRQVGLLGLDEKESPNPV